MREMCPKNSGQTGDHAGEGVESTRSKRGVGHGEDKKNAFSSFLFRPSVLSAHIFPRILLRFS
jgi:hypothetical protein